MTDNHELVPNRHAVSSDCLFNLKASSVAGKAYRASVPATNGTTFLASNTIILYVPAGRRNTFLDPQQTYLKFTINNTSVTAADNFNLDRCGACVINSINIYHGSNLLESIANYNVLFNYIIDSQMNYAESYGASSALGISSSETGYRSGALLNQTGNTHLTVCLPILSGLIGLGADKMLPLFALADDIRIEIVLEQNSVAFCWAQATTPTYSVTGVELEIAMIELSDEGMAMVNSVTPFSEAIFLHGNSFRHFVGTLPASSSGNQSFICPARHASLKTLIVLPRVNSMTTNALSYSLGSRSNPNISSYYWRLGGALFPQKPVTLSNGTTIYSYAEAYMEVLKSWHGLSKADVGSGLGFDYYNVADTGDNGCGNGGIAGINAAGTGAVLGGGTVLQAQTVNSYKAGFCIGTELELFAGRSDVIISGTNTLSSQLFFEFNMLNALSANSYVLDFYSNFDIIFVLQDGLLSARF